MPENENELDGAGLARKKRSCKARVSDEELAEAIIQMKGFITAVAAHFTMTGRPLTYQAIQSRAKTTPLVAEAIETAEAQILDHCENKLLSKIQEGDTTALIFLLKCKGKKRGYIERQQIDAKVENKNTGEIRILELPDNGRGNDEGKTAGDKRGAKRDKDKPAGGTE